MTISDATAELAATHLAAHDPVLAPVIARIGHCTVRPHKHYYQELVDSIISQQLSIKAAATIERRFRELFNSEAEFPSANAILTKHVDELRSCGLSTAKANYVHDLARHVVDGKVRFDHLDRLANEEVIRELTAVKGIGEWTAHMFLMFCMGRSDVLAHGDLGIKNGIQKLYKLDHLPTPQTIIQIAQQYSWHPYETVACWYIWQSFDNPPAG